jgi:hypothetical protein
MSEIIFVVEETPEGGYTARALGPSIYCEADSLAELHEIRELVDEARPDHPRRSDGLRINPQANGKNTLKRVGTA